MCINLSLLLFFSLFQGEAMSAALGIVTWMCFIYFTHSVAVSWDFYLSTKKTEKTKVDIWLK